SRTNSMPFSVALTPTFPTSSARRQRSLMSGALSISLRTTSKIRFTAPFMFQFLASPVLSVSSPDRASSRLPSCRSIQSSSSLCLNEFTSTGVHPRFLLSSFASLRRRLISMRSSRSVRISGGGGSNLTDAMVTLGAEPGDLGGGAKKSERNFSGASLSHPPKSANDGGSGRQGFSGGSTSTLEVPRLPPLE